MKPRASSDSAAACCKILGVPTAASQAEIRAAFRRLALIWHPDHNADDAAAAQRFREIRQAYEALVRAGDGPARRGPRGAAARRRRPGIEPAFDDEGSEPPQADLDQLLREAFGIDRSAGRARGGPNDLRFDLQLTGGQARRGAVETIAYEKWVPCPRCASGPAKGKPTCERCRGEAVALVAVRLQVRVPAGVVSGDRLRLKGAGDRLAWGEAAGDLVIHLGVVDGSRTAVERASDG